MKHLLTLQVSFFVFVSLILFLSGCSSNKVSTSSPQETTLLEVGEAKVSQEEFAYVYEKNNTEKNALWEKEKVEEYLNLFTDFKLKVQEAKARGLDTTAAFQREFESYKQQLSRPYLTEKNVSERLVKEAYERLKIQIRASHILVRTNPYAAPADTLAAFKKMQGILKEAKANPEKFNEIARRLSEDPNAKRDSGDLGYFTALQMVYPFENAAYRTKEGEVSDILRTKYGHHILKIQEKQPAGGKVKIAHIMVRSVEGMAENDRENAEAKIREIYQSLQKGQKWQLVCKQFSEDVRSRQKNGELPPFTPGTLLTPLEEVVHKLEKPGQYSEPVLSPYGWHVVKLLERTDLAPFDSLKVQLQEKVAKDSRAEVQEELLFQRLKKENNFEESKKARKLILTDADSSLLQHRWVFQNNDGKLKTTLFSLGQSNKSIRDFYTYLAEQQTSVNPKGFSPEGFMNYHYDEFVAEELLNYERNHLSEKYAEYRYLLKEYYEGILLFKIMEEEVWTKALKDSAGLANFYEANKNKHMWEERAKVQTLYATKEEVLKNVMPQIEANSYLTPNLLFDIPLEFPSAKEGLTEKHREHLKRLAVELKTHEDYRIEIEGFLPPTRVLAGSADGADVLRKRAKEVFDFFVGEGVDKAKVILPQEIGEDGRLKSPEVYTRLYSTDIKQLERTAAEAFGPLSLRVSEKFVQKSKHDEQLKNIPWEKGQHQSKEEERFKLVIIREILPPAPKTLQEVRGIIISDFQKHLEKEWLKALRAKYPVKVDRERLDKLVQQKEKK